MRRKLPLDWGQGYDPVLGDQRVSQHGLQTTRVTMGWMEKKGRRPSVGSQVSISEVGQEIVLTHPPV